MITNIDILEGKTKYVLDNFFSGPIDPRVIRDNLPKIKSLRSQYISELSKDTMPVSSGLTLNSLNTFIEVLS